MLTAFWADCVKASSTMSFRKIVLGPLLTALHVMTTFGLQSTILCARDSAENPANTTCIYNLNHYVYFRSVIKLP